MFFGIQFNRSACRNVWVAGDTGLSLKHFFAGAPPGAGFSPCFRSRSTENPKGRQAAGYHQIVGTAHHVNSIKVVYKNPPVRTSIHKTATNTGGNRSRRERKNDWNKTAAWDPPIKICAQKQWRLDSHSITPFTWWNDQRASQYYRHKQLEQLYASSTSSCFGRRLESWFE